MRSRLAVSILILLALAGPAVRSSAQFIPINQPDAAYLAATTEFTFADPDFTAIPQLTASPGTVSFSSDLIALSVPGTWSTWGSPPNTESATPRVLWTNGIPDITLIFSSPLTTIGFEAQPNTSVVSPITATFFKGAVQVGQIVRDVDGNSGALLFAATSVDHFTSVTISATDDFALAHIRGGGVAAIPEAATSLALAGLLAGLGAMIRRRKR